MKGIIKTGILSLIAIVVTVIAVNKVSIDDDKSTYKGKPIETVACSYAFNTKDLKKVYGFADYVSVVKVNKEKSTQYKNVTEVGNGDKFGIPYTEYSVTVKENLKGKLPQTENINILKSGGLSYNKDKYYVDEGDILLEEDKYYVMAFCVQEAGALLVSGMGATEKIDYGMFWNNDDVDMYKKICNTSINASRKRYKYRE